MKKFILITITSLILGLSANAGWWSNNDQQQINQLQSQLDQQRRENGDQGIVIVFLATGVVVALVVGAAVGSKARRAARKEPQ